MNAFQLERYRVSYWLEPAASCGKTEFIDAVTNADWCRNEVERINRKRRHACRVTAEYNGERRTAVFMDPTGEVAETNFDEVLADYIETHAKCGRRKMETAND